MALYIEVADTLKITNPVGMLSNAAWTKLIVMQPKSSITDGRHIFRLADDAGGNPARGLLGSWKDALGLRAFLSNDQFHDSASAISIDSWHNIGFHRAGAGTAILSVTLDGTKDGTNTDAPTEITTGDVFRIGGASGNAALDAYVAMVAWLAGVNLSGANADAYCDDPQSLYDAYGPSGSVTANALKLLLLGDLSTDLSGVGNHPTIAGSPGTVAGPAGYPTGLGGGATPAPTYQKVGNLFVRKYPHLRM